MQVGVPEQVHASPQVTPGPTWVHVAVQSLFPQVTPASRQLMFPHASLQGPTGSHFKVRPTQPPLQSTSHGHGPAHVTVVKLHPIGPMQVSCAGPWVASSVTFDGHAVPLHVCIQVPASHEAQPASAGQLGAIIGLLPHGAHTVPLSGGCTQRPEVLPGCTTQAVLGVHEVEPPAAPALLLEEPLAAPAPLLEEPPSSAAPLLEEPLAAPPLPVTCRTLSCVMS